MADRHTMHRDMRFIPNGLAAAGEIPRQVATKVRIHAVPAGLGGSPAGRHGPGFHPVRTHMLNGLVSDFFDAPGAFPIVVIAMRQRRALIFAGPAAWRSSFQRIVCVHSANYGKLPVFNCEKAPRELGIKWTPLRKTLHEMAARELKLVRVILRVLHTYCLLLCLQLTLCACAQGIAK